MTNGWQMDPATRDWHYYPRCWYDGFSACKQHQQTDAPVLPEPASVFICPKCVREMRRIARRIERLKETHEAEIS